MKVLLVGGTGFVGRQLGKELVSSGHQVIVPTRSPLRRQKNFSYPAKIYSWEELETSTELRDVEVVINLAGEGIADQRWSEARKKQLYSSRIDLTKKLEKILSAAQAKPQLYLGTSATGFYGDRGDEILNEESAAGKDFLSQLCVDWERAHQGLGRAFPQMKTHICRIGIVMGEGGGFLEEVLPIFQGLVGGKLGGGRQWVSWIAMADLVQAFIFLVENFEKFEERTWSFVSPEPVTNGTLTKMLGTQLRVPTLLGVPGVGLKVVFGQLSEALLGSQRVQPAELQKESFSWKFKDLESCFADVLRGLESGDGVLIKEQWVPAPLSEVFPFFESEKNLEELTPDILGFRVLKKSTSEIEAGTLIDYKLKIRGFPAKWTTLIESWDPPRSFVDTQLKGPYSKWHHTHEFEELGGGVLLKDRVIYRLPLWPLGNWFGGAFVRSDVEKIFEYRAEKTVEIFGSASY